MYICVGCAARPPVLTGRQRCLTRREQRLKCPRVSRSMDFVFTNLQVKKPLDSKPPVAVVNIDAMETQDFIIWNDAMFPVLTSMCPSFMRQEQQGVRMEDVHPDPMETRRQAMKARTKFYNQHEKNFAASSQTIDQLLRALSFFFFG